MKRLRLLSLAFAVLAGCAQDRPASPFKLTASIQDLMLTQVDPAADAIWESVSTVITETGVQEHQPRTDEEWAALRGHAITLVETANLLMMEGRKVTHGGKEVADAHIEGILDAGKIQKAVDERHPEFIARAHGLQDASLKALAAIEAHDAAKLLDVGGEIEQACEGCHSTFWYPDAARPE